MTKDEILERYLNTVYLGNGAYGVQAGAETYFGDRRRRARHRPVRVPRRDDRQPRRASTRSATRRRRKRAPRPRPAPPGGATGASPPRRPTYIARRAAADDDQPGHPRDPGLLRRGGQAGAASTTRAWAPPGRSARTAVFRGGLRIYTTLDPRAQQLATGARNDVLAEVAPEGTPTALVPDRAPTRTTGRARNATGAVVSVEPGTGAVRAMVGGAGFDDDKYNVTTQGAAARAAPPSRCSCSWRCWRTATCPTDSVSGSGPVHVHATSPGCSPTRTRSRTSATAAAAAARSPRRRCARRTAPTCASARSSASTRWSQQARRMGITTPLERGGVDAARHQGGVPDRHGGGGGVDRRRRHVQRAVLRRPGRGPRRAR